MNEKGVNIPLDLLVEILKKTDDSVREEIFERVFIEEDTSPLDQEEAAALKTAEEELKRGETVNWPFGQ